MTPSQDVQGIAHGGLSPAGWIAIGILIAVVGAVVTTATGDPGWVVIASVPSGIMLLIGVIAKGVEVGLRAARSD